MTQYDLHILYAKHMNVGPVLSQTLKLKNTRLNYKILSSIHMQYIHLYACTMACINVKVSCNFLGPVRLAGNGWAGAAAETASQPAP